MSRPPSPTIATCAALPDDAALLAEIAAATFRETFEAVNAPADFAAYMAAAFGEPIQRAELEDSNTTVFFARRGEDTLGYVMLREQRPPTSIELDDALLIARLYARQRALGSGVGAALMQRALSEAADRGKDAVWLSVWEHNERAIRFYESWGFHRAGTQPFLVGTDLQTDHVMVRRIARES